MEAEIHGVDRSVNLPPEPSILKESSIRISCAALARVRSREGKYLLLTNKNKKEQGTTVLTPIGGAIEVTSDGKEEIKRMVGIQDDAYEKGNDLRFRMDGQRVNNLREWFLTRRGRETDPSRELEEELVDEARILTLSDLPEDVIKGSFAGYQTEIAATTRTGQRGALTLRLLEIYDVTLPDTAMAKLLAAEGSSDSDIVARFVTAEEIQAGQTTDSVEIGSVARTLLNLEQTIEAFA